MQSLATLGEPVTFTKGAFLQRQGELARSYYWITQGVARTAFINSAGREVTLRFAVESEIAGAHEDLLRAEQGLSALSFVVAEQVLTAFRFDWARVRRLELEGRLPLDLLMRVAEYNLRKQANRSYLAGLPSAREKLTAFRNDYPGLETRITKRSIASYLDVTPQYLSQLLRATEGGPC
ncbi:Crp/Fnr family transcriptional regulator [Herbaspirillum sp. GCM10030257]|uniref:Crp/Fnr family transcriptional regulator n=1 Tax=Herbaspirillum sp. GCM10030257 TaxID=3273393 RepID=UPI003616C18E